MLKRSQNSLEEMSIKTILSVENSSQKETGIVIEENVEITKGENKAILEQTIIKITEKKDEALKIIELKEKRLNP